VDRRLAGFGFENEALDAHEIAQVKPVFQGVVLAFGQIVAAQVGLSLAPFVLQIDERGLAHPANRHDAPSDAHGLVFERVELFGDIRQSVGAVVAFGRERVHTCGP